MLWACVRSGNMEKADRLCKDCKQYWRFGSITGGSYTCGNHDGTKDSWIGDPHRNLWKYCCWELSMQTSFSEYERALYASCCGNLLQMFKVCNNWQDYLWACFRVLIDANDDVSL